MPNNVDNNGIIVFLASAINTEEITRKYLQSFSK